MAKRLLKRTSPLMRGEDVKEFQALVKEKGFDPGTIDGIYGDKSIQACQGFQRANGLSPDGMCGEKTWAALETKRRMLKKTSPLMQGEDVKEFQTLVKAKGFDPGTIDGKYGEKSEAACRAFQRSRGLSADGICGEKTWAALDQAGSGGTEKPHSAHFTFKELNVHPAQYDNIYQEIPAQYYANANELLQWLEKLRAELNRKYAKAGEEVTLVIRSGYRPEPYNSLDGGAKNSQHLYAKAADVYAVTKHADGSRSVRVPNCYQVAVTAQQLWPKTGGHGLGSNTNFHLDTRNVGRRVIWYYTYRSMADWEKHQGPKA